MIPRWTPGQWLLRVVIVLAPVAAVLAGIPAGASPNAPFLVVLVVVAVLFALFPASLAGVRGAADGGRVVGRGPATRCTRCAWWPRPCCWSATSRRCWRRTAPTGCRSTPAWSGCGCAVRCWSCCRCRSVWAVATVLTGERERPEMWVAGLVVACVGTAVATVVFGERSADRERFVDPL